MRMLPYPLAPRHPHDTNRHRRSMTKLVTTFAPPADHITTLYDNLEHSIKQYPNVRYVACEH